MGKGLGYFTNYPKHVFLILVNEFCERFSYYGMKAILVIYLTRALNYSDNTATAIYHAFNVLCYFSPLFGAMLADGWLGKFWTILSVSVIYAIGNIVMTVTAIPFGGSYVTWAPFIGLIIIAIGTGGIKPCVSAFGGDQFKPEMQRQKDSFFSLFYMAINIGSLLSMIITPIIRSEVYCFYDNCYCLAFGIPAALMIVSIFIFAIGSPWYTKVPPGENVLGRMLGCAGTAIKGKCSRKTGKKEHWLDFAETKYDKQFIADMKDVTRVLWLFLPLPVFWALYDQQGSRWTLQATQMNGDFGSVQIQPDQIQFLNALLVVIFVPLMESLIFPLLDKFRIPNRPLQRMVWGMIFAATAFIISAFVQIAIDSAVPAPAGVGEAKLMFINAAPCDVTVRPLNHTNLDNINLLPLTGSEYAYMKSDIAHTFEITRGNSAGCVSGTEYATYLLNETKSYNVLFDGVDNVDNKFNFLFEQEKVTPTDKSASTVRVFNSLSFPVSVTLTPTKNQEEPHKVSNIGPNSLSDYLTLVYADFDIALSTGSTNRTIPSAVVSRNGAIYTLLLTVTGTAVLNALENVTVTQITDMGPRSVNIFLQVPQYVVITVGEVLFSVTGLAFAYSQSPVSMKSLLQAAWLLTVCFGNVIVIIVAEAQSGSSSALSQVDEFFLFAGLLYGFTIIFIIMSIMYKYVEPRTNNTESEDKQQTDDINKEPGLSNGFYDNQTFQDEKQQNSSIYPQLSDSDVKRRHSPDDVTKPPYVTDESYL